jgi:hypothetical protein
VKPGRFLFLSFFCQVSCAIGAATVHYVDLDNANPTSPYLDWSTAATNIQDAIDVSAPGDTVLVTNGVYSGGGRVVYGSVTNRVAVTKPVTLRSINGPAATVIEGYQVPGSTNGPAAVRCAYLTNGAALIGITLANGATAIAGDLTRELSGGGVWCESSSSLVSNCWLIGNSAHQGGGGYSGTFRNCVIVSNTAYIGGGLGFSVATNCQLIANSAGNMGGGADTATLKNCLLSQNAASMGGGTHLCGLDNCLVISNRAQMGGGIYGSAASGVHSSTIVFNTAFQGGGTWSSMLINCICYYNSATADPNWVSSSLLYCCTVPITTGLGNITNEPAFMDNLNGDVRLATNSPCINSGINRFVLSSVDLDEHSRVVGGTVDLGAYEFQNPASVISYAWLQQYGLPTDGSVDYADIDGDGMNNWQEWICGTNPTNAASVLKMLAPAPGSPGVAVIWQSVTNRSYFVQRATNLTIHPSFVTLATSIAGQSGTTPFSDTNANGAGPFFYRVGVQP